LVIQPATPNAPTIKSSAEKRFSFIVHPDGPQTTVQVGSLLRGVDGEARYVPVTFFFRTTLTWRIVRLVCAVFSQH
jgi:hypothetical protein